MALPDKERFERCRSVLARRGGGEVLVVDDDHNLTALIEALLESVGFKAVTAHNGWDALHLLGLQGGSSEAGPGYDLVTLDYELGDKTGLELLGKIRQNERTRALPIIMLTGTSKPIPDNVPFEVEAFVRKPFEGAVFLETIIKVLKLGAP